MGVEEGLQVIVHQVYPWGCVQKMYQHSCDFVFDHHRLVEENPDESRGEEGKCREKKDFDCYIKGWGCTCSSSAFETSCIACASILRRFEMGFGGGTGRVFTVGWGLSGGSAKDWKRWISFEYWSRSYFSPRGGFLGNRRRPPLGFRRCLWLSWIHEESNKMCTCAAGTLSSNTNWMFLAPFLNSCGKSASFGRAASVFLKWIREDRKREEKEEKRKGKK